MSASPSSHQGGTPRPLVVVTLLLAGLLALTQNSSAQGVTVGGRPFPSLHLASPARGAAIRQALGSRLPEVAAYYGMTATQLDALVDADRSLFADVTGRLGYVCEGLVAGAPAGGASMTTAAASIPLSQTFQLHSRPGSTRTIFLDFDGNNTTGTPWNSSNGMTNIFTPPYDTDGDPANFSDSEKEWIQLIWQQVAEDYAPLDVDVTTADPGVEGLRKTSSSDQAYGVRACIGGTCYDWYGASAGGVSYVGDFNWNTDTPCFIFTAQLGNGYPKYVAEAVSHEVGHSLGLNHDGTTAGVEYYQGQGDWAPIMGVGYYRPITQFSKGEYASANNTQDDFAVMASYGAPFRADDHGNTAAAATVLPAGPTFSAAGTIERATDVDAFQFQSGPGALSIAVAVGDPSPNLNVLARLYDSAGNLLASANPATLGLTLTATVPSGTYTLLIEGVGDGDPVTTGYSDYGSMGTYTVAGTVPSRLVPPVAMAHAAPTAGAAPLGVDFSSDGSYDPNGTVVGYDWDFGDGSPHSSAPNPSHVFETAGNFTCRLVVTDNDGLAGFDSVSVAAHGPPAAAPSNLTAQPACDPSDSSLEAMSLSWNDNSSNVDHFVIQSSTDGVTFAPLSVPSPVTSTRFTNTGLPQGAVMYYRVLAANSYGASGFSNVASGSTYAAPAAVSSLAAAAASTSQINLSWSNLANETGYQLQRSPDGVSGWTQIAQLGADVTTFSDTGRLSVTTYSYRVRATGVCALAGPFSAVAQATTGGTITAPSSLAARASSWTKVKLTWSDRSTNEQGFSLERSTVKTFVPLTAFTVGANAITFTDTTATAKTTFYYRMRAFAGTTYSSYTSTVGVTLPADSTTLLPPAPSSLAATALAGPANKLTWKDNSVYELGFQIQRSTSSTFTTITQFVVGQNVTAFLDTTGLAKGTKYYYRMRAYNGAGNSGFTSSVSVTASSATAPAGVAAEPPAAPAAADAELTVVRLGYAAPNPFAQRSTITFELPAPAMVDLAVFDVGGRQVASLASGLWAAGRHQAQWDGRDQDGHSQASGVFFVRLAAGRHVETRKLILAR